MGALAITGGKPVRKKPFSPWPIYTAQEQRGLLRVLRSRNWGGYPFPNEIAHRFAQKFAKVHGANTVPTPPMIGVSSASIDIQVP